VKRLIILVVLTGFCFHLFAQDSTKRKPSKQEKKAERQQYIAAMVKQDEEGALIYNRQSVFGVELRTNGYGLLYEFAKRTTRRKANIFTAEFTEIKDPKEQKTPTGFFTVNNPYVYGKEHNFYQFKLGFGQQYLLGQKGNKNGVALFINYQGGFSAGLLRPYYLEIQEGNGSKEIKYTPQDSSAFLDPSVIIGSAGLGKGWNEMTLKPGIFAKTALRFDWGHYNELVSGIEVGLSVEAYSNKIPILLYAKEKQFFFQGHIALVFGRRRS
jgi:hypothetical protein